jgi:hypothetical protein
MTPAERHDAFRATVRNLATAPRGANTTSHAHLTALQQGLLDALKLDASRAAKEGDEWPDQRASCDTLVRPGQTFLVAATLNPELDDEEACAAEIAFDDFLANPTAREWNTRLYGVLPMRRLKPIPA